jgi:host factor-I protein
MHLVNGIPLKGIIRAFDTFVVLFESNGQQMMIYKHAISTVTPSRPVQYYPSDELNAADI